MAQAFQTIYNNNYRKHPYCKTDLIKQIDEFLEKPSSEGNWRIESVGDGKTGQSRQDLEEQVKLAYSRRYKTTYFTSYCHEEGKISFYDSDQESSNELINRAKRVFKKKIKKIAPPLPTSRKLWGYMRPDSLYVPLSTYQKEYDYGGYNVLKDGLLLEDCEALMEENRNSSIKENLSDVVDYETGMESTDAVAKQKLDKLDGLSKKPKKSKMQTLDGVICGKSHALKL